jgi:regulator of replication initiation timing
MSYSDSINKTVGMLLDENKRLKAENETVTRLLVRAWLRLDDCRVEHASLIHDADVRRHMSELSDEISALFPMTAAALKDGAS